jgi:hypothetical protein
MEMLVMMSFCRAGRFIGVPILLAALVGCSGEAEETPDATASEPKEMTEREILQAKKDAIFNPTPEQMAERKAKSEEARLAVLPHLNELPAKPKADRNEYIDISEPFLPLKIYLTYRTWEEPKEQLAKDIREFATAQGGYLEPYEPASQELRDAIKLVTGYRDVNAFEKADALKAIETFALEQAKTYDGSRLVKFIVEEPEIQAYDITNKTFGAQGKMLNDAGSRINNPNNYKSMIISKEGLRSFIVDDEKKARAIEAARQDSIVTVYGYVSQVTREQRFGELTGSPEIKVEPHFADIHSKDGKLLHTIEL